MTKKYTAADFANARFAEHGKEDDPAFKRPNGGKRPWKCACGGAWSDEDMADMDWVPVTTKSTITESQFSKLSEDLKNRTTILACALERVGIKIIPDPEPTNTERLRDALARGGVYVSERIAERLDEAGVTAPNVKDN